MDPSSEYNAARRSLEKCSWNLVSRLHVLTEQLMMLVGKDRAAFIETKAMCTDMKQEILESHDRL